MTTQRTRPSRGGHDRAPAGHPSPIDRASAIPAYSQIANLLRAQIAEGKYRPGESIPTVQQLVAKLGVASMTVRQAIAQLVEEGLVVSEQGRGTFVQEPDLSSAKFTLDSLTRQLVDKALTEKTLVSRRVTATAAVATRLAISVGAAVTYIERILLRDDEPIFYQTRYVLPDPARRLADVEKGPDSLRGLFLGYGEMGIKNGRVTLHADALSRSEAAIFGCRTGQPAWAIDYVYFDFQNRPVICGRLICLAQRLSFSAPVGISDHAAAEHGTEHRLANADGAERRALRRKRSSA